jgi:SAM-dependent methyltransferase
MLWSACLDNNLNEEEAQQRAAIFGEVARAKADLAITMGLSPEGRIAVASPGPGYPDVLELLWSTLNAHPGVRVADLGAGLGGAAAWMQARGATVTAFELEEQCVSGGQALFPELDLRCGDAGNVPLEPFEVVTAFGLLSLSPDPQALLRSIAHRMAHDQPHSCRWIASVDLVATGTTPIKNARNSFVSLRDLSDSLPGWDLALHQCIRGESRNLWRDVHSAVEGAWRTTVCGPVMEAFDSDQRTVRAIVESGAIEPAITVFSQCKLPNGRGHSPHRRHGRR